MNELFAKIDADDLEVVLPNDLSVMTTYVVVEQRGWFEHELPFVRRLVEPGDVVADIGANFGMYALAMAKRVGPGGRLVAFEPTPTTAAYLRRSLSHNGFSWVDLREVALSDHEGTATFSIGTSPELNQLNGAGGTTVTVTLETLARHAESLRGVSFIKLDAEGAEVDILRGSGALLEDEDPLVMFELAHGAAVNLPLIEAFRARGFEVYRYVPGLGALRHARIDGLDRSALNLFAAKPSRAERLARRGLLVPSIPAEVELDRAFGEALWGELPQRARVKGKDVPSSVAWFAMAKRHPDLPTRAFALDRALLVATRDVEQRPTLARRLTLARCAREVGSRDLALRELGLLLRDVDPELSELEAPFLSCLERWDEVAPGERIGPFLCAQVMEGFAKTRSWSGYFDGAGPIGLLRAFESYGFPDREMKRRLGMATRLYGDAAPAK